MVIGKIWLSVVFLLLLKLWLTIGFQLDQFLHESSIFVVLIGCIHPPCNRGIAAFPQGGPYNFPYFQEGHISLVLHLKYFLFFFVNITWSCVSRMILSAVGTFNFLQAIFQVLLTTFNSCLLFSTGCPVVFIYWAFEIPQGSWDILLNTLKNIANLQLLGSTRLIKCYNVSVGLDSFFAFSDRDSYYICNSLFSQDWCYHLFCSQCQLPTPDNYPGSVEFLMWVGSAFHCMKVLHF